MPLLSNIFLKSISFVLGSVRLARQTTALLIGGHDYRTLHDRFSHGNLREMCGVRAEYSDTGAWVGLLTVMTATRLIVHKIVL